MARGRRCPFLPLPLSPRAWGAWQHVEEGLVLVLTEGKYGVEPRSREKQKSRTLNLQKTWSPLDSWGCNLEAEKTKN